MLWLLNLQHFSVALEGLCKVISEQSRIFESASLDHTLHTYVHTVILTCHELVVARDWEQRRIDRKRDDPMVNFKKETD